MSNRYEGIFSLPSQLSRDPEDGKRSASGLRRLRKGTYSLSNIRAALGSACFSVSYGVYPDRCSLRDLQCTTTELQVSSGRLQSQYSLTVYVVGFEEIFDGLLIHQVELSVVRIPVCSAIGERDDLVTLGDEVSSNSSSKKTTGTSDCD